MAVSPLYSVVCFLRCYLAQLRARCRRRLQVNAFMEKWVHLDRFPVKIQVPYLTGPNPYAPRRAGTQRVVRDSLMWSTQRLALRLALTRHPGQPPLPTPNPEIDPQLQRCGRRSSPGPPLRKPDFCSGTAYAVVSCACVRA
jgi:hypothetical protein